MTQKTRNLFGFVAQTDHSTVVKKFRIGRAVVTLLLLAVFNLFVGQAAALNWTGGAGAGNEQWSNFANFTGSTNPSGMNIVFDDVAVGAGAGVVNNIVDASVTIGSLTYTKSVLAATTTYHTTQIDAGQTLTVTGTFSQGLGNPPCSSSGSCTGYNTNVTFTGSGTFDFDNSAGNFYVGRWSGNWNHGFRVDTLDLSTLSNFTMDANRWEIGRVGAGTPTTMTMADTNVVAANTLDMGQWNDVAVLELGRDNTLNINTISVGYNTVNSSSATLKFDTGLVSPSVIIRDKSGSGAATLNMSRPSQSGFTSVVDFTGGNVDALFGTVRMGTGSPGGGGNSNSTLTFNQGLITASDLDMTVINSNGNGNSTVNINGTGSLHATTVNMVDSNAGSGNGIARINLGGGTLRATTIQAGDSLGSGSKTREINFNSGTIGNLTGVDSTIGTGLTFQILTTGAHAFDVTSGQTMTVNSNINGAGTGAVNKTGAGTLLMLGTNSYVAPTNVLAGTIGGTGAAGSDFIVASGATLAPGASAGTFLTDDAALQAGSTLSIEIGGLVAGVDYDQLLAAGDVTIDGDLVVSFINGFSADEDDVFTILSADSVSGTFSSATLAGGNGYFDITYLGNSIQLSNFQVPEPSSFTLLGLSMLGCQVIRRRRRRA